MESKVKEAVQRKMCGYNCAQAVACTYCEQAGLDEETVKNLTQGFAANSACLFIGYQPKMPQKVKELKERK